MDDGSERFWLILYRCVFNYGPGAFQKTRNPAQTEVLSMFSAIEKTGIAWGRFLKDLVIGMNKNSQPRERTKLRVFCSLLWIFIGACSVSLAQSETEYIDKANGFKIKLTGNWRAETYTDAVGRQKTEFVCKASQPGRYANYAGGSARRSVAESRPQRNSEF